MLLTAVHIDDNEVTNDSVISHGRWDYACPNPLEVRKFRKFCHKFVENCSLWPIMPNSLWPIGPIVTIWLLLNEDASWNKQSVIGRLSTDYLAPIIGRPIIGQSINGAALVNCSWVFSILTHRQLNWKGCGNEAVNSEWVRVNIRPDTRHGPFWRRSPR